MSYIEEVDGLYITDDGVVLGNVWDGSVQRDYEYSCSIRVNGRWYDEDETISSVYNLRRSNKKKKVKNV